MQKAGTEKNSFSGNEISLLAVIRLQKVCLFYLEC